MMYEPMIKFSNDSSAIRLINYLKSHNQEAVLRSIEQHPAFSFQYDVRQGSIEIHLYDLNRVVGLITLTVDEQIDRYNLWQYFYSPEHRDDEP